jgi:hypothetical protein
MKNVIDLLEFFCSTAAQHIRNLNHMVLRRAALSDPQRAPDRARLVGAGEGVWYLVFRGFIMRRNLVWVLSLPR